LLTPSWKGLQRKLRYGPQLRLFILTGWVLGRPYGSLLVSRETSRAPDVAKRNVPPSSQTGHVLRPRPVPRGAVLITVDERLRAAVGGLVEKRVSSVLRPRGRIALRNKCHR